MVMDTAMQDGEGVPLPSALGDRAAFDAMGHLNAELVSGAALNRADHLAARTARVMLLIMEG